MSLDGRGAWRDNSFIARLWRTIQYQEIYRKADDSVAQARPGSDQFIVWYHPGRPHSCLGKRPPLTAYQALLPALELAA